MDYSEWSNFAYYKVGDTASYLGANYLCVADNINDPPPSVAWTTLAPLFPPSFAEFVSNTTQPLPATIQTPITFDAKNIGTADITLATPSSIRIATTGTYRAIWSVQIDKTGGGGADVIQLWFSKNGGNVPNTNTQVATTQQITSVMTIESFLAINAGDTLGVVGYTPAGAVQDQLTAYPIDATHPVAVPSIIINIQRIA